MRKVEIINGNYKGQHGWFHGFFQIGNLEHGCDPIAVVEFLNGECDEVVTSYIRFIDPPASEQSESPENNSAEPWSYKSRDCSVHKLIATAPVANNRKKNVPPTAL